MIFFENFFQSSISANLIAALLHSLWQAACIAALLYIYLRATSAKKPSSRYIATLAAMLLLLLCLITTFAILQYQPIDNTAAATISSSPAADSVSNPQAVQSASVSDQPKQTAANRIAAPKSSKPLKKQINWRPWALAIWLTGVCVMLIRAASMAMGLSRLCRSCKSIDDPDILAAFHHLCDNMNITRKITLLTSSRINIPCVIGAFRPVILLPASIITGIPADDLSAILAHELAHIRRHDYLINFCQMIIEAVLFFNPAMWWISRQLRIEREACCDAVSITATGKKLTYARALANFAQHIAGLSPTANPAIAFGKPENPNSLLDRIKRILITDHRPHLRISWPTTLLILIASIVVIFALQKTTNATVKYIGKILTPQERIEKIEQLQKEYSPGLLERPTVPISGYITTIDGKSPTDWMLYTISAKTYRAMDSSGCGRESDESKNTFNTKLYPGQSVLCAFCPGYAPFMTYMEFMPGESYDGLEILFDYGFKSSIKVTDKRGNPIPNVSLKAEFKSKAGYIGSCASALDMATGPDGIAVIENAIDHPMSLDVVVSGYEKLEDNLLTLKPDHTHIIVLKKSNPASGIILDKLTGQPVSDAEIRIIKKDKPGHIWHYSIRGDVAATSDQQGVFTLDSLEKRAKYQLLITTPDHGYAFATNVRSGQQDIKITLPPPVSITGTIKGDLSKLPQGEVSSDGRDYSADGNSAYGARIVIHSIFESNHYHCGNDWKYALVTAKDGIGHFRIEKVFGNLVYIRSNGDVLHRLNMIPGKYEYDIVIDLDTELHAKRNAKLPKPQTRNVIVNFITPQDMPAPEGEVQLEGTYKISGRDKSISKIVDIKNGTGTVDVPVPAELGCGMQVSENARFFGYWFEETYPRSVIKVSDQPYELNIEIFPAGNIYGTITDASGSKVYDCDISIMCTKTPNNIISLVSISSTALNRQDGKQGIYNASPLPLGGKYRLTARYGNYTMVSPEIELTEAKPIAEYNFVKDESIDFTGRIFNHASTPMANVVYRLWIITPDIWHGAVTKMTDSNGGFNFLDINPDKKVDYQIEVDIDRDGVMLKEKLKLKLTDQPQVLKLKRSKSDATIKGFVVDGDTGLPIIGVAVQLYTHDKKNNRIYSAKKLVDDNGSFEIPVVRGYRYSIEVIVGDLPGYTHYNSKSLNSLDNQPILFEIKPLNSLAGIVIDADTDQPVVSLLINGHCKYGDSKSTLTGDKFNPIADANGRFSIKDFIPDTYIIDDIPGYTIIGSKQVDFSKGKRNKNIEIKVRKNTP